MNKPRLLGYVVPILFFFFSPMSVSTLGLEPCRLTVEAGACESCPCGSCDEATERDTWDPSRLPEGHLMAIRIRFVRILDSSNNGATQQQLDDQFDQINAAFLEYGLTFVRGASDTSVNSTTYSNFCSSVPGGMTCFCPDRNGDCLNHTGQPAAVERALKQMYSVSPDEMLNVFVTNVSPSGAQGLGYYPWWGQVSGVLNGILLDNDFVGGEDCGPYPLTDPQPCRLLVHEIGHELGLYHPFDLACGCETEECDATNDLCCDTPMSSIESQYVCEGTENLPCDPEGPTPDPSDPSNYMGYAWDGCWDSFTPQQVRRMHCWTCDRLKGWIDSPDCNDNEIPDVCEITRGDKEDCDENGILDECEMIDCNENDNLDVCDIECETSIDCDENGVPDECQVSEMPIAPCCYDYTCMMTTESHCDDLSGNWANGYASCMMSPCLMNP